MNGLQKGSGFGVTKLIIYYYIGIHVYMGKSGYIGALDLPYERNFAELARGYNCMGRIFCIVSSNSLRCTPFSSFERYARELAK